MKKLLAVFLCVLLMVAILPVANVSAGISGDYFYRVLKDGTARIDMYTGKESGTLKIPKTIGGYKVTVIGKDAFSNDLEFNTTEENCRFKRVVIPEGVTKIGEEAFYDCIKLKKVKLPKSLKTIGNDAFYGCRKLSKINFPKKLKVIGDSAFWHCDLKKVKLPNSLKIIGESAFYDCISLKKVKLPGSLNKISKYSFANCKQLKEVVVSKNTKVIDEEAFRGCNKLKKVTLPDTITRINESAFESCDLLKSIYIPKNAKIGEHAFGVFLKWDAKTQKKDNFKVYGHLGSDAQRYAIEMGLDFVDVETNAVINPQPLEQVKDLTIENVEDVQGSGVAGQKFSWSPVTGVHWYVLEIGYKEDMSELLRKGVRATGGSNTVETYIFIDKGETVYVRIKAMNNVQSSYSEIKLFRY